MSSKPKARLYSCVCGTMTVWVHGGFLITEFRCPLCPPQPPDERQLRLVESPASEERSD